MKQRLFPILGLSILLSSQTHANSQEGSAQIEGVLSTYSQKVQDVVRKSYCYEYRENDWVKQKSNCNYSLHHKNGILIGAQIREEILKELEKFPPNAKIETTLLYRYFSYYGEDLGNSFLSQQFQNIKVLNHTLSQLSRSDQEKIYASVQWNTHVNGKYVRLIEKYEKFGDIRGKTAKNYLSVKN